ncbi:MAG: frataxin domain-containing protein [Vicinamibacterales bacterium]
MSMLTEQEFRVRSDEALEQARRTLLPLADAEGFEVELHDGVLDLVFEEPTEGKFVVSPNAPVRQIWVSAMARSYKLGWSADHRAFTLDGEPLADLLGRLARTFLAV